ncbi:catechol 1,2-dioxygenase [Paraburkholderia lycopersici]|uniref:Catechol 1,2-dioxygenase n=1 Tax=Paraburkholderia lycopersici TaxID=416944 RepID=A0A1G6W3U5_9BURK|nr:catechol 1,2-dioxygenase [Paraburkholderia lycopersici]
MPVGYGCPPQGATQQLLNGLGRHGNRPAHVHFFVTSESSRKLTTQFNIEGDPLIWDDFAYATREELIPHVAEKTGGTAIGLKADTYKDASAPGPRPQRWRSCPGGRRIAVP